MRGWMLSWIIKGAARLIQLLPYRAACRLASAAGWVVYIFDRHRTTAYANVKSVFGDELSSREIRAIVIGSYRNLATGAMETLRIPVMTREFFRFHTYFEERDGYPKMRDYVDQKKGVVLATGHMGSWELAQIILQLKGFPMNVVQRPQPSPHLDALLNQYRSMYGTRSIARGMALRDALRALKRGEVLGVLQDQSGGAEGTYVPFFGRRTSFATGAFKIARRANVAFLPVFMLRNGIDGFTYLAYEPRAAKDAESRETELREDLMHYVHCLEDIIRKRPNQWLWMHKRWKYTKTRIMAVLIDEKAGHAAQAEAILESAEKAYLKRVPDGDVKTIHIPVCFKSTWHRHAAFALAPLLSPWLQSRPQLVLWTLTAESRHAVQSHYADTVISCGASLLPIQLAFAKECNAKKIVVMKPPFPYALFQYDLALVPEHDRPSTVKETFYLDLAPNRVTPAALAASASRLRALKDLPPARYVTFLVGGDSKNYQMDTLKMDYAFAEVRRVVEHTGARLLVTTSRRTDFRIEALARRHFQQHAACALLVIANEKNIEGVVYGMMALSDVIVVTEDSISMISESIMSEKPVIVLEAGRKNIRPKFERFKQLIRIRNYAVLSTCGELGHHLSTLLNHEQTLSSCPDRERLSARLAEAL